MATNTPDTSTSKYLATSATSQTFAGTMGTTEVWRYICNAESFISQGAAPTATADGSSPSELVPANSVREIDGAAGAKLACIGVAGKATLTRIRRL